MPLRSAVGTATVASDAALMFPHSSPVDIVVKLVSAGSRFSLVRWPGVMPFEEMAGLLTPPTFARRCALERWRFVGLPPKESPRSIVPVASRTFAAMLALSEDFGLRWLSMLLGSVVYHHSTSLFPL